MLVTHVIYRARVVLFNRWAAKFDHKKQKPFVSAQCKNPIFLCAREEIYGKPEVSGYNYLKPEECNDDRWFVIVIVNYVMPPYILYNFLSIL